MLKWFYTRIARKRLAYNTDVIDQLIEAEDPKLGDLTAMSLVFPLVIAGLNEKSGMSEDQILDPSDLPMSERLKMIHLVDSERKRIEGQPEDDATLPTLQGLDCVWMLHMLRFNLADQPHILPAETEEQAARLSGFVKRRYVQGRAQIRQAYATDTPVESQMH